MHICLLFLHHASVSHLQSKEKAWAFPSAHRIVTLFVVQNKCCLHRLDIIPMADPAAYVRTRRIHPDHWNSVSSCTCGKSDNSSVTRLSVSKAPLTMTIHGEWSNTSSRTWRKPKARLPTFSWAHSKKPRRQHLITILLKMFVSCPADDQCHVFHFF